MVIDVDSPLEMLCTLKTGERNIAEKYITQGWYKFAKRLGVHKGDTLHCSLHDKPTSLYMKVVKKGSTRIC